jgi:hypothetical protein
VPAVPLLGDLQNAPRVAHAIVPADVSSFADGVSPEEVGSSAQERSTSLAVTPVIGPLCPATVRVMGCSRTMRLTPCLP